MSNLYRVAKCLFFFTKQNLQTKFYPKKSAEIATIKKKKMNRAKLTKKITLKIQMLTTLSNWTSFHLKILHKMCKSSRKGLIWLNCVCSQTFYPNMQIFLHRYIRHFRDVLQLWIWTSCLKSVDFLVCCWCWGAIDTDGDQLSLTKNGLSRQQAWSTHPLCCQGNNPNPSLKN